MSELQDAWEEVHDALPTSWNVRKPSYNARAPSYEVLARPFEWKFTRADLTRLLERLATRDANRLSQAA